tara:strand:+ start:1712 stop:1984 length:273 start_codon:yes stop_codon:yes gene_type:complete
VARAKGNLGKWFREQWVDISRKKKGGGHPPCGRKSSKKGGGYPKCVPKAKAAKMSASQKKSAVSRKRAVKQGVGGKPSNVSTFARKKKKK